MTVTLDYPIQLHFIADWGVAGLHRIAGWLSAEVLSRTPQRTRTAIWNGLGGTDAAFAVGRGEAQIGLATPVSFCRMAVEGLGPFACEPMPHLRGLGVLPQDDRMIAVARKSLGISSFEDIRRTRPALRIAASPENGHLHYGIAAHAVLAAHGLSRDVITGWGGEFLEGDKPNEVTGFGTRGEADIVIQEAVMAPYWHEMMDSDDFVILPFEDAALDLLEAKYRMKRAVFTAGRLRGIDVDSQALEFSDFLVFGRADLPEDVAELIASILVEGRHRLEAMYAHIPSNRSALTYPIDPVKIPLTDIPLHPGAERYYREAGLMAAVGAQGQ